MGKKSRTARSSAKDDTEEPSLPRPMKVSSFVSVPFRMNAVDGQPTWHYLFVRAHEASLSDLQDQRSGKRQILPPERTLFVVNLPVDATPLHLKALFQAAGAVERVRFPTSRVTHDAAPTAPGPNDADSDEEADVDSQVRESTQKAQGLLADLPAEVALPPLDARVPREGPSPDYAPLLTSGATAHVVFVEASVRDRALDIAKSGKLSQAGWPNPFAGLDNLQKKDDSDAFVAHGSRSQRKAKHPETATQAAAEAGLTAPPEGLNYLLESYRRARPPLPEVRAYADAAVLRHEFLRTNPAAAEALEEIRGEAKKSRRQGIKAVARGPNGELLDEDGFVIVGSGQMARPQRASAARKRAAAEEENAAKKKKKSNELEGFYKFQRTEKKRDELAALRNQFKKDTEKVAKLKQTRRFKPY